MSGTVRRINGPALGVQVFVGQKPDPRRVLPLLNGDGVMIPSPKPLGGVWTSTWDARRQTSEWMEHLARSASVERVRRGGLGCWLVEARVGVRVIVIDSVQEMLGFLTRYGRRVAMTVGARDAEVLRLYLAESVKSRQPRTQHTVWLVPDYEAVAEDGWAGIHLTARGAQAVRFGMPNLYTWDCESTFWTCAGASGEWPFSEHVVQVGDLTERIVEGMLVDGTATVAGEDQRIVSR